MSSDKIVALNNDLINKKSVALLSSVRNGPIFVQTVRGP
jgi:hypothetical protein